MPIDPRVELRDLVTVAIADGLVSPEEVALIYSKGDELGLDRSHVNEALKNPYQVEFTAPDSLLEAITRLYDLARVVVSDGVIHPKEVELLRTFARRFQMKDELIQPTIDALLAEVQAGTSREVLIESLKKELGS